MSEPRSLSRFYEATEQIVTIDRDSPPRVLFSGEDLLVEDLPVGTRLRVGEAVELEITQIGKTCHKGCAIRELVGDCVMPKEGVFARVLKEGVVRVDDAIEVLDIS